MKINRTIPSRANACKSGTIFDFPSYPALSTIKKNCLRLPSMSNRLKSFTLKFTCDGPKIPAGLSRFLICLVIIGLSACTQMPPEKPAEKTPIPPPPGVEPEKEAQKPGETFSLLDILLSEALKFKHQENYQDALFIYNQALSQAFDHPAANERTGEILQAVEATLSLAPAKDIKPFIDIKKIRIPRPLLLYWYGLNTTLENNDQEAREVFTVFLFEYPDHPYAPDVADLLSTIKESLFKKDTIGCLLPLSGKYAIFGQRVLSGIQMAIRDLSQKYNREFKLVVHDTRANPQTAVDGVRKLNDKKVAAIIGPLLTVSEAGLEAQKLQIPMIGLTQKSDLPLLGDYLFSNFITPEMQVRTLGAHLFRDLGIQKVAILYPDEKYGRTYMELFWDVADEYGVQIVGVEPYDGKKTDFTDPIQKLTGEYYPVPDVIKEKEKQAQDALNQIFEAGTDLLQVDEAGVDVEPEEEEPDDAEEKIEIDFEALFIPDSPSTVSLILPQLAFNDATGIYLVGTNLWHHKSLLKDAGRYNRQAIITDGFFDGSRNPATAAFSKQYKDLYHQEPGFLEAISYDCANILYMTAMDPVVDSRAALKNALKENRIFEGATGHTLFDQEGRAERQLFLITIKKGRFTEIRR